jgi:glycosyltransferase involved in cell wall biosynthesis
MRICIGTPYASRQAYGIFPIVVGTSRALVDLGHAVQVFAGNDEYALDDRGEWGDVPVRTFHVSSPRILNYLPGLSSWLSGQPRFDVLSLQGVWMASHATGHRYAKRLRVPMVLTPQGSLDAWALRVSAAKKKIARFLYTDKILREVDCFHVNSESEACAVRNLGLRSPICIIPNGVVLPPRTASVGENGSRTLLFLGRLHTKKGIRELARAWKLVGHEASNWKLVIAGPDELGLRSELENITRGTNIEFVGPVFGRDKDDILQSADAFILPSFSEGFPMAVLEAWAFGLPVLMTRECNIDAGFQERAAIEIRPEVESIAAAIRSISRMDSAELKTIGGRGRALVERSYSWRRVAGELVGVYEWLCGRGDRPTSVHSS